MAKKKSSAIYFFGLAAVIVVGLVGFKIYQSRAPSPYDSFAECLTDSGAKMYGAWWCPHCERQKESFGSAFRYVEYIECSPGGSRTMSQQCRADGIEGFPTWEFADGSRESGEQSFRALAEASGCQLPTGG
jgi:hypothetical protein